MKKPTGYFKVLIVLTFVLYFIASWFSLTLPHTHDYYQYVYQWSLSLQNGHPWQDDYGKYNWNAYGPLNVMLALPYGLHTNLPRFIFTTLWFVCGGFIVWFARTKSIQQNKLLLIWAFIFLNPFFWSFFPVFGNNEIVTAFFLLAGLFLLIKEKKNEGWAGVSFALGALFKFVPLFAVPFIFFGKDKLRWKFLTWFLIVLTACTGISWVIWGNEIFTPLVFGMERESKFLSIFSFFRENTSYNMDKFSLPLMIAAWITAFIFHLKKRLEPVTATIVALMSAYLFYKVNNPQFHTNLLLLIPFWFIINYETIREKNIRVWPLILFCGWITLVQTAYICFGKFKGEWAFMYEWVGLPSFIVFLFAGQFFMQKKYAAR